MYVLTTYCMYTCANITVYVGSLFAYIIFLYKICACKIIIYSTADFYIYIHTCVLILSENSILASYIAQ